MTTSKTHKPPTPSPGQQSPFATALTRYQETLDAVHADATALLPVLLARDEVEHVRSTTQPLAAEQARRLFALDARLREYVAAHPSQDLSIWRQSLAQPATAWWWWLDQEAATQFATQQTEHELPWRVLTGVFGALTIPIALDIIKRLWDGAPDTSSLVGTILTILLTGSPFSQQGQALGRWLIQRTQWFPSHRRAHAIFGITCIAFLGILIGRVVFVPLLARSYNNRGFTALVQGNLASAQQDYQRAVALDPDLVVPYYSLAESYVNSGRFDTAQHWYEQAIDHDRNFIPPYRGLGYLYNLQGEPDKAERIILAALDLPISTRGITDTTQITVTRYTLLADLGWAYFAQQHFDLAQAALEESIQLEPALEAAGKRADKPTEYRLALPHYYLAQIYERLNPPIDASAQWTTTFQLLDQTAWRDCAMILVTRKHVHSKYSQPTNRCHN